MPQLSQPTIAGNLPPNLSLSAPFRSGLTSEGAGDVLAKLGQSIQDLEDQSSYLSAVNDDQLAYMAELSALQANPDLSSVDKGKAVLKLSQDTLSQRGAKAQESMSARAFGMYQQKMQGFVTSHASQHIANYTASHIEGQKSNLRAQLDTIKRDAATLNPGSPEYSAKVKEMLSEADNLPEAWFPNKAELKTQLSNELALAVAERIAYKDPQTMLKTVFEGQALTIDVDGEQKDVFQLDPKARESLVGIARARLNFDHQQVVQEETQAMHTASKRVEQTYTEYATRMIGGDLRAYDEVVSLANKDASRTLINGEKLTALKHLHDGLQNAARQGTVTDPQVYARIMNGIIDGKAGITIDNIMADPNVEFSDKKALTNKLIEKNEQRLDKSYGRYESRYKDAMKFATAWVGEKNPLFNKLGIVDSAGEQQLTKFRIRMEKKAEEARKNNTGYDSLDPMSEVMRFTGELTQTMEDSFQQDATHVINSLKRFVPPKNSGMDWMDVHVKALDNINKSDLPQAEKLLYTTLLQHSLKNNDLTLHSLQQAGAPDEQFDTSEKRRRDAMHTKLGEMIRLYVDPVMKGKP